MHHITVVGSGTMGNGIAHTFAQSGYRVSLVDVSKEALKRALSSIETNLDRQIIKQTLTEDAKTTTLNNIKIFTDLQAATVNAELVIEAATENFDTKIKLFKDLDHLCLPETILATNTSSISITKLASVTSRPERVIGMHFMNPVPIMKLVEVIKGFTTNNEVTSIITQTAKELGKQPVVVNDYPGFIANRILMPMINEAIYSLYEGVAGVVEIDTIMKLGMAHPMGPLQLADFIGLDVCLAILNVLHQGFGNPKYAPCPLLINMVAAKNLGIKTKIGFYDYSSGTKDLKVSTRFHS
ncbi:3-hydroxyacyl-CoA dehydrogenase NAD-binding domain-containing protein [Olivibacter domesticus]|uniref:3-hydroxybutyryl-CoA dehydrogenase n=2 Tax=Olivibacter domesticus TaxID=407022 RepID=A0A1H7PKL5_OLID1|nr:3-hydroxyacyl-CoA dehydrogenase NAD-binding domain-containing protein [Olivibacter domesticus]SEL36331.1 3-hydroxybutyryl-CoA dehydrogenase [Olivibacter domesticus]